MSQVENYFIKSGYKINNPEEQIAAHSGDVYWTKQRIEKSYFYQLSTYQFAKEIIIQNNLNSVLDVGTGCGVKLMKMLAPVTKNVTGVDLDYPVKYCRENYPNGEFFVADFNNPNDSLGKTFDLIICSDVIEHIAYPENLLRYIKTHAHAKTKIIISTPERDILRGKNCSSSPKLEHIREWNQEEFCKFLLSQGLKVNEVRILEHMEPNLSLEFIKKLVTPGFKTKHNMCVLATV